MEGLISKLGYIVTPAMDGEETLRIIRSREFLPDIVVLDVEMPNKTGFEVILESAAPPLPSFRRCGAALLTSFAIQVCEELRSEFPEGLPILMVSGSTDDASIVRGLQVLIDAVKNWAHDKEYFCITIV